MCYCTALFAKSAGFHPVTGKPWYEQSTQHLCKTMRARLHSASFHFFFFNQLIPQAENSMLVPAALKQTSLLQQGSQG